jgi:pantoate--beta-alanine ligase
MRVVSGVRQMQKAAIEWQRQGIKIGLVPTMGFLHEGHIWLIREARRLVGTDGKVVASIYVNPSQFGPREDFAAYPRDLAGDKRKCKGAGVDTLFVPSDAEMYPVDEGGPYSTWVVEERLGKVMEGKSRPTHFRGVTTVVAKLFNIVRPDLAVFGAKDYQQAAIIGKMARDLNFPTRIVVAPTQREADGLALSSRNRYLSGRQRREAVILWDCLKMADALVRKRRGGVSAAGLKALVERMIQTRPEVKVDYIEFFDGTTLEPVRTVKKGTQMALAAFVGSTRLIDNAQLGSELHRGDVDKGGKGSG